MHSRKFRLHRSLRHFMAVSMVKCCSAEEQVLELPVVLIGQLHPSYGGRLRAFRVLDNRDVALNSLLE